MLWHHAWTAVFAANLVVPMWFASELKVKGEAGDVGTALAVAFLWLLGDLAGARSLDRRRVLLSGGLAVALSQLFPILQILAGAASLNLVGRGLGIPRNEFGLVRNLSGLGCFLATLLTGTFLLLAAYFVGRWLRRLMGIWRVGAGVIRPEIEEK